MPAQSLGPVANSAITEALTADDLEAAALRTLARSLATTAINQALYYLEHGSPANRIAVIRAIMPAIGKGMAPPPPPKDKEKEAEVVDELAELRSAMGAMMRLVTGEANEAGESA